jgi:hypothetical protein
MTLSKKQGVENETLLEFKNEPIIVLSQLGTGKALFIGDGSSFSNFPLHRMGTDNTSVALKLFELLQPGKSQAARGGALKIGSSAAKPEKLTHVLHRQVRAIAKFDHPLKANAELHPRELYRWKGVEETKTIEFRDTSEFAYPWLLESPLPKGQYQAGQTWRRRLPMKILPLEMGLSPRNTEADVYWTFLGLEKPGRHSLAKVHATGIVSLVDKPLDALLSPVFHTIEDSKHIEKCAGSQYFEAVVWVNTATGQVHKANYEHIGYGWFALNFTPYPLLPNRGAAIAADVGSVEALP